MRKRVLRITVWFLTSYLLLVSITSATLNEPTKPSLKTDRLEHEIEELFSQGKTVLDVKLLVDEMVDSSMHPAYSIAIIDQMVKEIAAMLSNDPDEMEKLSVLRRYLYEAGTWNNFSRFEYDPRDPLGNNPKSRFLYNYLRSRKGNCITMPILMLALGQRIGLEMALAEAPLHTFVKFTDLSGRTWNIEATSGGGITRDAWYRKNLRMSDQAVSNGVYLRTLTHNESVALIASFLVEDRISKQDFQGAIKISNVLLQYYPNFAYGLVKMGSAYTGLLRREFISGWSRDPSSLSIDRINYLSARSLEAFTRAEALGWTQEDGPISQVIENPLE